MPVTASVYSYHISNKKIWQYVRISSYHFYEELKNNYFQFLLSGEYHIRYQIRISIFRYNYDTRYGQQKVVSQAV